MITANQSKLWLEDSGLTTMEIEAALAAAYDSLTRAGYSTDHACEAAKLQAAGERYDAKAAEAWRDAEIAALNSANGARETAIMALA